MASTGKTTSIESADIARKLGAWYRRVARDLPWRRTRDPYAIWVSEVMLQQTQVATVIPYYERWMRRFPNVTKLARADESDVLGLWQGLGYYSRARGLLAGARAVVSEHAGRVPSELDALRRLPSVGPYTAGAIASLAFGKRAAIVDGNVTRVLSRLFALDGDPTKQPHKRAVWLIAETLVPARDPGSFNQALMELGATICTPKNPRCGDCPLRAECRARREERVAELPRPKARPRPTEVQMVAAIVERRGRWLVTERPLDAPRWAGLWSFPTVEVRAGETAERAAERAVYESSGLAARAGDVMLEIVHGITRFRITLSVYRMSAAGRAARSGAFSWKARDEINALALPAPHRRIANVL